jgi:hypothetical protein
MAGLIGVSTVDAMDDTVFAPITVYVESGAPGAVILDWIRWAATTSLSVRVIEITIE